MEYQKHFLEGVIEFFPKTYTDNRGWFMESYTLKGMEAAGLDQEFVQDNQSVSLKNVLRGLHFQKPPFAQAKLVRVITGSVLDVVVDIRKDSETFGKHLKVLLSADRNNQLFIPAGFAHGFLALEENTTCFYKCSGYYNHQSEGGLCWSDPNLNIDWGISNPVVSEKDQSLPGFKNFESPF